MVDTLHCIMMQDESGLCARLHRRAGMRHVSNPAVNNLQTGAGVEKTQRAVRRTCGCCRGERGSRPAWREDIHTCLREGECGGSMF